MARAASGELWVACHDDDRVRVLDAQGTALASLPTGYGSAPVAVAISPDGATAYVTLEGAGALARFDTVTRQQTGTLTLPAAPRAIAVSGRRWSGLRDPISLAARSRRGLGGERVDARLDANHRHPEIRW